MRDVVYSRSPDPSFGRVPVLASVPVDLLVAERSLMLQILDRTVEEGNKRCEAAARRCVAALEDEILRREEC
jgi:hypothetical protein